MPLPTEEKTNSPERQKPKQKPSFAVPGPEAQEKAIVDFLAFRRFATPILVQAAFWVGSLAFFFIGVLLIERANQGWQTNSLMAFTGLFIIILGPLALRIGGELILVVFRINEQLELLRKKNE